MKIESFGNKETNYAAADKIWRSSKLVFLFHQHTSLQHETRPVSHSRIDYRRYTEVGGEAGALAENNGGTWLAERRTLRPKTGYEEAQYPNLELFNPPFPLLDVTIEHIACMVSAQF